MAGADIPGAVAPGLDLFVTAWAEEWIRYGGSITASPSGGCNVAYRAQATGPGYGDAADLHEAVQQARRDFDEAHYHGRMRSMLTMLEVVPHASEALHAHMCAHAIGQYYTGQPGAEQ
jgi:hypothetical protein